MEREFDVFKKYYHGMGYSYNWPNKGIAPGTGNVGRKRSILFITYLYYRTLRNELFYLQLQCCGTMCEIDSLKFAQDRLTESEANEIRSTASAGISCCLFALSTAGSNRCELVTKGGKEN